MKRSPTATSCPRPLRTDRPRSFPSFPPSSHGLKVLAGGIAMSITRSRILIADDHTLIADLCRKLLETEFEVVGIVNNGRAMVRTAAELKPDVILVDITMPVLN